MLFFLEEDVDETEAIAAWNEKCCGDCENCPYARHIYFSDIFRETAIECTLE